MFHLFVMYIKQGLRVLKENTYISLISIIGTALAVGMIMTAIIADRAGTMNLAPEVNRERTLYVKWVGLKEKATDNIHGCGYMSLRTIKECFQSLKTPEAVTVTAPIETHLASLPGGGNQNSCYVLLTDDVFWKVFQFDFLAGKPYLKAEFDAGINNIVLSEQLARSLFGGIENAVGKQIHLSLITYTVCGVVNNVSSLTEQTYAHAWIPYTSTLSASDNNDQGITGKYKCQIIAHSRWDFDDVRKEVDESIKRFNISQADYDIELFRQPDNKFTESKRFGPGWPDMESQYIAMIMRIAVILIIPAINLSGFTLTNMRKRITELGIRKAFGCTRARLIWQLLTESVVYSLIGGAIGLLISYVAAIAISVSNYGFNSSTYWGMDVPVELPMSVLIDPFNFLIVVLLCMVLNVLSACIPAWRVTSVPIVESLKED